MSLPKLQEDTRLRIRAWMIRFLGRYHPSLSRGGPCQCLECSSVHGIDRQTRRSDLNLFVSTCRVPWT